MSNTSFKGFLSMAAKLDPHTNALKKKWGKYKGFNNLTSRTNQKILELQKKQEEGEGEEGAGAGTGQKPSSGRRMAKVARKTTQMVRGARRFKKPTAQLAKRKSVIAATLNEGATPRQALLLRKMRATEQEGRDATDAYNEALANLGNTPLRRRLIDFLTGAAAHLSVRELTKRMEEIKQEYKQEGEAGAKINNIFRMYLAKQKVERKKQTQFDQYTTNKRNAKMIANAVAEEVRRRRIDEQLRKARVAKEARENSGRRRAALFAQSSYRGRKERRRLDEMRAEAAITALEAQVADEDEGEPDENFVTNDPLGVAINKWSDGDFRIEKTNDDGDCLFEAFAYQLRRNGSAFLKYLGEYEEEYGRFPEDEDWPFPAKSARKQGVNILRHILASAVRDNWYPDDAEEPGENYMDFLSNSVNDGNLYNSKEDYFKHMTSPNLATAIEQVGEENYKPRGRFGDRPELLEFQTLFGTKIQIIVASMVGDTTTLKFKGPEFKVIKDKIYDTDNVLTLIFYATIGNRDSDSVSASHYEIIALTEQGERKKNERLVSAVSTDIDEGKSAVAVANPSGKRKSGECAQVVYEGGAIMRGIIVKENGNTYIKGLYIDNKGLETFGKTAPFSPDDWEHIKNWNPTHEALQLFVNYPERKKEKYNTKLQRVNRKIDGILNKFSAEAQDNIKRQLKSIVELRFKMKSRLETKGRDDEQVKKMTQQQLKYKNLVKKYIIRQDSQWAEVAGYVDSQLNELVTGWTERTNIAKEWKEFKPEYQRIKMEIGQITPLLEKCVTGRRGGKRKRKTKRKRRKRKKKKSTRRKRRKRRR